MIFILQYIETRWKMFNAHMHQVLIIVVLL